MHASHTTLGNGPEWIPPPLWGAIVENMGLSGREKQILDGLAKEMSRKEIAAALGRDEETIQTHLERMFIKCNCRTRVGIVAAAVRCTADILHGKGG